MQLPALRYTSNAALIVSITLCICILYAAGTINRNRDFKSPLVFLEDTVKTMPPLAAGDRTDPRFFEPVKNFYTTYKNLGIIYYTQYQWDNAIHAFRSALEFTPFYLSRHYRTSVQVLLAVCLERSGKPEEAMTMLRNARPFAENPAAIDNRMGMIAGNLGNDSEAERYFRRALRADTACAAAHYNLGILYIKCRSQQKGLEELVIASRLNPKYLTALDRYRTMLTH